MLVVGAFGLTLLGIGLLEKIGMKVNEETLLFGMTILKFGGILYILNMASNLFL